MRRHLALSVLVGLVASAALVGQQAAPAPSQQPPTFRSSINLVLVDVVVRDRSGAVVKGLKADDFELQEDGARQQILTFAYEEVTSNAAPIVNASTLTSAAGQPLGPQPRRRQQLPPPPPSPPPRIRRRTR